MRFPKLDSQAILSPMAGVTDVAFRTLCKRYGAALTCTEFVSSTALVRGSEKTQEMLATDPSEKPVAVQLFGSSEEDIVASAQLVEKDFDIIDLNCGCPAWKVIKTGAGSALLNDPEKIGSFLKKIVDSVNKPVTVKIRAGINHESINAVAVARAAEKAGAAAIAIHGRTQKQGYSGLSDWDIIKEVKDAVSIPVIGNGDVFSPEDFKEKLEYSGVDAILIARGAIGNPYIFRQIDDYLRTGKYEKEDNRLQHFFEYLELAKQHNIRLGQIKGHAIAFTKGMRGGAKLRQELGQTKTLEELEKIITEYKDK